MIIGERPKNLRTILLALPKRTRRTKKYVYKFIPGKYYKGVRPGAGKISHAEAENWRLTQLSKPKKPIQKYVRPPDVRASGLSPETIAGKCTSRSHDLSRPKLRYLVLNKRDFLYLDNPFVKNMDKKIDEAWNCIYNFYKKQLRDMAMIPKPEGKGKPKVQLPLAKRKEEIEKKFAVWAAIRSQPKRIFPPPPPPERKIADMGAIRARMERLAEPKVVTDKYIRPSINPAYIDPLRVTPAARAYIASEHVLELARMPAWKLIKIPELKPGAVKRGALKGPVPPRFAELAVPKKKAAEKDNDLKENPFMISKNAMRYNATDRILELAKPIER